MKFEVLKSFTWAGSDLARGDTVEIPDESPKIGSLTRAKFIRLYDEKNLPIELPRVEDVAREIDEQEALASSASNTDVEAGASATRDPRAIVRMAKAKAVAKK